MFLTKVDSTEIKDELREVKVLRLGDKDVQTANEVSPFGIDSNPLKDMIAIYGETSNNGDTVIVGYLNKNRLAQIGELRIYSTDDKGAEKFYTWLKNDGTMEIGGDTDNMVRYSELETAFNELKSDFNDLVAKFNSHIHITTATVGSTPTPGVISPTTTTATPSAADITPSKIEEIKTM